MTYSENWSHQAAVEHLQVMLDDCQTIADSQKRSQMITSFLLSLASEGRSSAEIAEAALQQMEELFETEDFQCIATILVHQDRNIRDSHTESSHTEELVAAGFDRNMIMCASSLVHYLGVFEGAHIPVVTPDKTQKYGSTYNPGMRANTIKLDKKPRI